MELMVRGDVDLRGDLSRLDSQRVVFEHYVSTALRHMEDRVTLLEQAAEPRQPTPTAALVKVAVAIGLPAGVLLVTGSIDAAKKVFLWVAGGCG